MRVGAAQDMMVAGTETLGIMHAGEGVEHLRSSGSVSGKRFSRTDAQAALPSRKNVNV